MTDELEISARPIANAGGCVKVGKSTAKLPKLPGGQRIRRNDAPRFGLASEQCHLPWELHAGFLIDETTPANAQFLQEGAGRLDDPRFDRHLPRLGIQASDEFDNLIHGGADILHDDGVRPFVDIQTALFGQELFHVGFQLFGPGIVELDRPRHRRLKLFHDAFGLQFVVALFAEAVQGTTRMIEPS